MISFLAFFVLLTSGSVFGANTPEHEYSVIAAERWVKVDYFDEKALNGPPKATSEVMTVLPQWKNGEDAFLNSSGSRFNSRACFQFDYHINAHENYGLRLVQFTPQTATEKVVWRRQGFTSDTWTTTGVFVNLTKGDQLNFVANTIGGSISLKGLTFDHTMEHCQFSYINSDFDADRVEWNADVKQAKQAAQFAEDHTFNSPTGKVAHLKVGSLKPTYPVPAFAKCFTFWFYRPSAPAKQPTEFWLDVNGERVWKTRDEIHKTDEWTRVQIPLNLEESKKDHKMEFMVAQGSTPQQEGVLLDDFKLTQAPCQAPVSCSFNETLCGWILDFDLRNKVHGHQWKLGSGRVEDPLPYQGKQSPLSNVDHVYADFTGHVTEGALRMKSDFLPNAGEYCVRGDVLYNRIKADDSFMIFSMVETFNAKDATPIYTLNSNEAAKFEVDNYMKNHIEVEVPANNRPRRLSLYASSKHALARMGVQNLQVTEGKCHPTVPATFPKSKLDKSTLLVADELMKNSRTAVSQILNLIGQQTQDPIKTVSEKVLVEINAAVELIEKNLKQ